jgi:hypothetical protein
MISMVTVTSMFLLARIGSSDLAAGATKKLAPKKTVTKQASHARNLLAATVKPSPTKPSALIRELGPLTGSPEDQRNVLVQKWGFPTWWPTPIGRTVTIFESRTVSSTNLNRYQNMLQYLDSPLSIEQLADRLKPPSEYVRQPADTNSQGLQTIIFRRSDTDTVGVELETTGYSVAEGKYRARYWQYGHSGPGYNINDPTPPGQSLKNLVSLPPGTVELVQYYQLTVARVFLTADGTTKEASTPDAPDFTYRAVLGNAPADYVDQISRKLPPGFKIDTSGPAQPDYLAAENSAERESIVVSKTGVEMRHTFKVGEVLPG